MAAFVASVSDIDDLIPCMVTFQIEWNKIHQKLNNGQVRDHLLSLTGGAQHDTDLLAEIAEALDLTPGELAKLEPTLAGTAPDA